MRYAFIEDFCGDENELNVYESLKIHQNGLSNVAQFSMDSFQFSADSDQNEIYLHCSIVLCDPDLEDCSVCQTRRRRSADLSAKPSNVGTIGPYIVG